MKKIRHGRSLRVEPLEKKWMLNAGPLVISEFMAKNETILADEDGDYCDWIEIHNPTTSSINLQGWHLTDDESELNKWTFPDVTIGADEYMVIFASDKDRIDPASELHVNFKITTSGEYLGLTQPDETVAFAYSPTFPEQYEDISYGGSPGEYFLTPTPGEENISGSVSNSGIEFSRDSGVFYSTFSLTLTTDIPDATIRYTANGSEPTSTSPIYTTPLTVSTSVTVRAKVFSPVLPNGGLLAYEAYIKMAASLNSWDSNLPVIVLHAQAEPNQTTYIETAAAFFEPGANGRTDLNDLPVLDTLSAIKIRGSSSASFPKKQYSFEIQDGMGEDLDASLFGLPEESDWVLYAPYSDKSLMRNYLAYNWSDAMGQYSPDTVFCEVFLNTDNGVVEASDYVGVYVLLEKIKIGENRVDIEEINGGTTEHPEVTGGVILKIDRSDSDEFVFMSSQSQKFVVHKPNLDELNTLEKYYIRDTVNAFETALYGPNFTDPEIGYAAYIDVESFIDEHLLIEMAKQIDGYRLSNYFYFDDETKLTSGPVWDYNLSMGNADYLTGNDPTGWYYDALPGSGHSETYPYYPRLFEDPNFTQQYVDRWFELRSTIFATDVILAQITETADYLAESEARDQATWNTLGTYVWPNGYVGETYADEIDYLSNFLRLRLEWIDSQFLTAPLYSKEGGQVDPGESLIITVPDATGTTIYYTTDGSDPRLSGGAISPVAQTIAGLVTMEESLFEMGSTWHYNDTGTSLGTAWRESGYDYNAWASGSAKLGYGDGDEATVVSYGSNPNSKHPTTYFVKSFEVTDSTLIGSLTLNLIRDDGAVVYLNGQEVVRSNLSTGSVNYNTLALLADDDGDTAFQYTVDSSFLVEGTNYIAVEVHQTELDSSDLSFNMSLSALYTASSPITIDETMQVVARAYSNGEWSAPTEATFVTHPELAPIISEIMYHPNDPSVAEENAGFDNSDDFEFIEIYNPHSVSISLDGLTFADGVGFDFTTDSSIHILGPDERIVIVRDEAAFTFRYGTSSALVGEYSGKLSNSGELLLLVNGEQTTIQNIPYGDDTPWPSEADGNGSSLLAAASGGNEWDPSYWFASEEIGGTPGWAGVLPVRIPGDANRDGYVDGSDVTILANHWQYGVSGTPDAFWSMGDFNSDGKVDGSDVTILANNWQHGVAVAVSVDSPPKKTNSFTPPKNVLFGVATVSPRSSIPPRRAIIAPPAANDTVLADQTWNSDDLTAVARDLTEVASKNPDKKAASAADEVFGVELAFYDEEH